MEAGSVRNGFGKQTGGIGKVCGFFLVRIGEVFGKNWGFLARILGGVFFVRNGGLFGKVFYPSGVFSEQNREGGGVGTELGGVERGWFTSKKEGPFF